MKKKAMSSSISSLTDIKDYIQSLLDKGERVLISAARRSRKTTLALKIQCDLHVVHGARIKKITKKRIRDSRRVVIPSELDVTKIDNTAKIIILEEHYLLPVSLQPLFKSHRPLLCIGTPLENSSWDELNFDTKIRVFCVA